MRTLSDVERLVDSENGFQIKTNYELLNPLRYPR